jgi:Domain of unknown function (DUF4279)
MVDMAEIDRASASFRLFGDTLNPEVVSEQLGMAPSSAGAKGESRPSRKKSPPLRWRTGSWILESRLPQSSKLDEHLRDLLDRLEAHAATIRGFVAQGYRADIFCGCFLDASNEGTLLQPDTIRLLGLLGVPLGLDIYCLCDAPKTK